MKIIRFHPAADSELVAAAQYYEGQQTGLGKRFLMSVQDAVNRIILNPNLYQIVELDIRRCLTKTFPFGILFRKRSGKIVIIAVMHLHRDPNYWKNR